MNIHHFIKVIDQYLLGGLSKKIYGLFRFLYFFLNLWIFKKQFRILIIGLWKHYKKTQFFCFFPRLCVGGADKVQIQLTNFIKPQKSFVFISREKCYEKIEENLESHCYIFYIDELLFDYKKKDIVYQCMAFFINKNKNNKIFGSISAVFWDLLGYVKRDIFSCYLILGSDGETFLEYSVKNMYNLKKILFSDKQSISLYENFYKDKKLSYIYENKAKLFPLRIKGSIVRERKFINPNAISILYVGRDNEKEKRISWIKELAYQAYKKKMPFQFSFTGNIMSFSQESYLHLTGYVSEEKLEHLYKEADIVILLSRIEGMPFALMDASRFGCVPLCTAVGGISEYYTHQKNAFLIPSNLDKEKTIEIALQYLYFISQNIYILDTMKEENYKLAEEKFINLDIMKNNFKKEFLEI
jgi:glycosyltransferase involved in cell wall biosynthesis